eukprot:6633745-Prymnesium_polylepis.1
MTAAAATRNERRERMVETCERQASKYRAKMTAAENKVARSDEFVEELQTTVAQSTMGGVVHAIVEVVGKAMGKNRGGGVAKLVEMMGMTADTKGQ